MILQFSINHLYDTIERTKQRGNNCEKILSFIFLTFILLLCSLPYQVVLADELDLPAQSAIAVEADTGKILYEKDSEKKRDVGGLSTLLTTYLIFEAIHVKKNFL